MFANRGTLAGLSSGVVCLGAYAVGGNIRAGSGEIIVTADDTGQVVRVVPGSSNLDLLTATYVGKYPRVAFSGALLSDGRLLSDGGAGSLSANESYPTTRRGDCPAWAVAMGYTAQGSAPAPQAPPTTAPAPQEPTTTTAAPQEPQAAPTTTAEPQAPPTTTAEGTYPTYAPAGTDARRDELEGSYPNGTAPAATTAAGPAIPLAVALAGAALFAVLIARNGRR